MAIRPYITRAIKVIISFDWITHFLEFTVRKQFKARKKASGTKKFTAVLFTTLKNRKQLKYPTIKRQLTQLWPLMAYCPFTKMANTNNARTSGSRKSVQNNIRWKEAAITWALWLQTHKNWFHWPKSQTGYEDVNGHRSSKDSHIGWPGCNRRIVVRRFWKTQNALHRLYMPYNSHLLFSAPLSLTSQPSCQCFWVFSFWVQKSQES